MNIKAEEALIIKGDKRSVYLSGAIFFLVPSLSLFMAILKDKFSLDLFILISLSYAISFLFHIWANNIKIIIADNYFYYINFFSSKKCFYSNVVSIEKSFSYNGPLSPINATIISFKDGYIVKINNFLFKENEIDILIERCKINKP